MVYFVSGGGNYDSWKTSPPEYEECENGSDCDGCEYCEPMTYEEYLDAHADDYEDDEPDEDGWWNYT